MDMKNTLINEFLGLKDINANSTDTLIRKIETFISSTSEPASELERILLTLKAYAEDYKSSNIAECSKIVAPLFNYASNQKTLEYLDIVILGFVLHHAPDYKLANEIAQKSVDTLLREHTDKKYKSKIFMIYMNMTYRMLRAKYYDIKDVVKQKADLKEIEALFDRYVKLFIPMCEEHNRPAHRAVVETRQALFNADCEKILRGLKKLKKLHATDWLKTTKDEVEEYLSHFNDKLTTALRNLRIGMRLRKSRLAINMTAAELADRLDLNHSQINAYESGERGMRPTRLIQVADILGCSVSYLNGEEDALSTSVRDPLLHRIYQTFRNSTEADKKYLLDHAHRYLKQTKQIREGRSYDSTEEELEE